MNLYIWGTEEKANRFYSAVNKSLIHGVIDSNELKHGQRFYEMEIRGIEDFHISKEDLIVICSSAFDEIIDQLNKHNVHHYLIMAPEYYKSDSEFDK